MSTPIALTIAGSDSGGGAGIQADLKTFTAFRTYGASVITALTAQNTRSVTMVEEVSPGMVAGQLAAIFDDLAVEAIKIGMLASSDIIGAVATQLYPHSAPIVLDPVMIAKSGDTLLQTDAINSLRSKLLPICTVLTPNIPEAARLLDSKPARDEQEMVEQGRALLALGPKAVLMKGGHMQGPFCIDLLVQPNDVMRFQATRILTENTHGTGCSLSAAITAGLAHGRTLPEAVARAHNWLQGAIEAADRISIGSGHGPVHHFHEMWADS